MGKTDLSESGLEALITAHLREVHGYAEGDNALYAKDVAIAKPWLEAFLVGTQPGKVARSMCFASPSETAKFYARLDEALAGASHFSFADGGKLAAAPRPLPARVW